MHLIFGRSALQACVLAGICLAGSANASDTLSKIRDARAITIAYQESKIPFSYLVAGKKPVGYTIEICQKLAEAVRRELKLSQMEIRYLKVLPSERISAIVEGRADLECGSTTNNAERRKQVDFTYPHFVAAVRMLVRTESGVQNWSDLRGKRVVTTKGTTTVRLLNDRAKVRSLDLQLLQGKDDADSFDLVATGGAEAFPMDDVILFALRANGSDPSRFAVVGDPLSAEPYGIMLRKDDSQFKAVIDQEMGRLIFDGDIYKLYDKWFMNPIPPRGNNLNMPVSYLLRDSLRFPSDRGWN